MVEFYGTEEYKSIQTLQLMVHETSYNYKRNLDNQVSKVLRTFNTLNTTYIIQCIVTTIRHT